MKDNCFDRNIILEIGDIVQGYYSGVPILFEVIKEYHKAFYAPYGAGVVYTDMGRMNLTQGCNQLLVLQGIGYTSPTLACGDHEVTLVRRRPK